jgi:hypothetical protein
MEELLQATEAMARGGHLLGTRLPRLTDLAHVLVEFERELAIPNVPASIVRTILGPIARFRRRRAQGSSGWTGQPGP